MVRGDIEKLLELMAMEDVEKMIWKEIEEANPQLIKPWEPFGGCHPSAPMRSWDM